MDNKFICSKPYTWFEVTQVNGMGQVYLCCPFWLEMPVGNLQNSSVEEIWNGKKAQDIRKSILDGSFKYCVRSRCAFLQTMTGPVQPIHSIEDKEVKEAIEQGLTRLPYGPKQIICGYDRSCNLSCPSCRTEVIIESEREKQILGIREKLRKQALGNAQYLYITGSGDPFGSPYFRKWLQSMKRNEMPKLNEIRLHTNAMLWNRKVWNLINVDVQNLVRSAEISIDAATEKTYSINRRGGSFRVLLKNLEFISGLRKNGPLKQVTISMVVQENNFHEMPAFIDLGKYFGFDTVYFSQLVNYGTFTQEELLRRAVHNPDHPKHEEFADLLKTEVMQQPMVHLGNLSDLLK
jgi:MoaA/NifB/PqqE/SkfB family radical SAM enzyme